jgi:hypothetical protein
LAKAEPRKGELGENHAMFDETWPTHGRAAPFQVPDKKEDVAKMRLARQTDFCGGLSFFRSFFGGNFGQLERGGSVS